MVQRILMIEDDHRLAAMVGTYLERNGFGLHHASSGCAGLDALRDSGAEPFAAVLLDLMLPDGDGLDICRSIRASAAPRDSLPILMLTAKGDPLDRVVGLELGADDYLPKPFEPRELLARLRAVLRRPALARAEDSRPLRFGRLEVDRGSRAVTIDGTPRAVTSYQFDLLLALAERAGRVLTREQLLDAVRGEAIGPFDRSIDVHVGRLRAAIEDDPRQPRRILTVRGVGYVFARDQNG